MSAIEIRRSKSLLTFVLVELKEAQHVQEGKLERQLGADLDRNYIAKDFKTIKLDTYNINRLKVNSYKLDVILDWVLVNDIDILGINKTNIAEQQGKFMIKKDSNYVGFWTEASESKIKGSGVEVVISRA